ncbi:bacterioferritin [Corticibacter populi]|uniref:Bacterioferritin n=1 Tax=Corticibacter populi TaxID=1550736 RepID=A0A3M6QZV0_9BURK|nr:bacterioferritin [Corticibacter populi]RMX08547.1 bacterioferritin [Corticibacter populi]RZS35866.1 bacterioferritin [Corticibacter populi]
MIGDAQVMTHLQAELKILLTGINQTFVHYRMLQHWGFGQLGHREYKASIKAMKEADALMERIFLLDGLPNLQDLGKLRIGEDVPELLACDLALELDSQRALKSGIAQCERVLDYVSRDLLQGMLDEAEERIDFLETQLALIEKMGLPNYLQAQMGEESH